MQHQDEVLTSDEFGISWLVKPDDLASLVVTTKKKKKKKKTWKKMSG
jgi:predicted 3-demethylubiquinone-9 3-methyltransferase (glyoxalase superfamily)